VVGCVAGGGVGVARLRMSGVCAVGGWLGMGGGGGGGGEMGGWSSVVRRHFAGGLRGGGWACLIWGARRGELSRPRPEEGCGGVG